MKLLAIVGSPRLNGNTNYLVDEALGAAAKLGVQTEKLILSQYKVNPCLGHENCASFDSCRQKDDTGWMLDRVCEADGVILATPVYYYNVTAQMKNFIDRNYFLYKKDRRSQARAVGIIIVAEMEGIEDTLHTLNQFVDWAFNVEGDKRVIATGYASRLGDAKNSLRLTEDARKLGRLIAESLKERR